MQVLLDSWEGNIFTAEEAIGFRIIQDYRYPLASTYNGNAEECIFTFSLWPEQIPGTDWVRDRIINAFESEVTKQGAGMLSLQVYEDASPVWHTDYRVIAVTTASPVAWVLIIGAVLLLLFLFAIAFIIVSIIKFVFGVIEPIISDIAPFLPMLLLMFMLMVMFKTISPKEETV